jgi:hypothetical protein
MKVNCGCWKIGAPNPPLWLPVGDGLTGPGLNGPGFNGPGLTGLDPVGAGLDGPDLIGLAPADPVWTGAGVARGEANPPTIRAEPKGAESGAARN